MTRPGAGAAGGSRALAYGVDVGGTKVLGVAVDARGGVVAEARATTPHVATGPSAAGRVAAGEEVAGAVAGVVRKLVAACGAAAAHGGAGGVAAAAHGGAVGVAAAAHGGAGGVAADAPIPVGLGLPGLLDPAGVLRFSPNLPGAAGIALGPLVADRLRTDVLAADPVVADNDANCAARAELALGAARGARQALVVTFGTGIGAGLIVDGALWAGGHGFAGEVGHMVVDPSGPPCPCGGRGCWERFASGGGLARLAREAAYAGTLQASVALAGGDPDAVRGEHVTRAATAGDAGALAVIEQLGWWVALGLVNLVAAFDPERIVVGGGLAAVGEMLLAPVRRAYADLVEGAAARPVVPIVPATLGERAGAVGAALLAGGACP